MVQKSWRIIKFVRNGKSQLSAVTKLNLKANLIPTVSQFTGQSTLSHEFNFPEIFHLLGDWGEEKNALKTSNKIKGREKWKTFAWTSFESEQKQYSVVLSILLTPLEEPLNSPQATSSENNKNWSFHFYYDFPFSHLIGNWAKAEKIMHERFFASLHTTIT